MYAEVIQQHTNDLFGLLFGEWHYPQRTPFHSPVVEHVSFDLMVSSEGHNGGEEECSLDHDHTGHSHDTRHSSQVKRTPSAGGILGGSPGSWILGRLTVEICFEEQVLWLRSVLLFTHLLPMPIVSQ